jgi:hypothetical protein
MISIFLDHANLFVLKPPGQYNASIMQSQLYTPCPRHDATTIQIASQKRDSLLLTHYIHLRLYPAQQQKTKAQTETYGHGGEAIAALQVEALWRACKM